MLVRIVRMLEHRLQNPSARINEPVIHLFDKSIIDILISNEYHDNFDVNRRRCGIPVTVLDLFVRQLFFFRLRLDRDAGMKKHMLNNGIFNGKIEQSELKAIGLPPSAGTARHASHWSLVSVECLVFASSSWNYWRDSSSSRH